MVKLVGEKPRKSNKEDGMSNEIDSLKEWLEPQPDYFIVSPEFKKWIEECFPEIYKKSGK